jgi:hypothetical protein
LSLLSISIISVAPNKTIEVTTNEIADDYADVEDNDAQPVVGQKRHRDAQVIVGIGHTVRESAHDEEWYSEEQRKVLTLTRKGDCRGHDETATDGENSAFERTNSQTPFKDFL